MSLINVKQEIKTVSISSIKPWQENPRGISDEALSGLRSSLVRFGLVELLVVNSRNMQLLSGHQRLRILIDEGIEEVPCVMVDLDDMAQQALAITLNNQQIAGYFTQALIPILENLRQSISTDYLNLRLGQLREEMDQFEIDQTGKTLPDDIPPAPKETVTRPGDIWILGNHRLMCGDSTDTTQVKKLMDGHKARLMATDPPYLVDYTGADRPGGGKDWSDVYHEIDIVDAKKFMEGFIGAGLEHIEEHAAIYVWHADRRYAMIKDIFEGLGLLIHQHIIWVKPCSIMTFSVYPWRHEPCIFGWRRGHKPFFRPARKQVGSVWKTDLLRTGDPESPEYYSDLWEFDWEGKKRNNGLEHPTIKPTEIFATPMRVHTNPGDICYEPFSGSGSQIIAAERVNRRCFAMEIEPIFCDVSVRRWENFTGRKAEKLIK